ncbi:MAG: hypothetical protein RLZZ175_2325 [Bacteroidota bacterium]|jgi:uncharacterized protein (TIGR02231 family)
MIKHFLFTISIVLFLNNINVIAQEKKTVEADIKQVVVFLSKAQITNTTTTTLEGGTTELTITGLSPFIDKNSVQASGKGEMVILGVKSNVNHLKTQVKSAELIQLEDTLEKVSLEVENLKDKLDILTKQHDMLLKNQEIGGKEKSLTPDDFEEYLDIFRDHLTELKKNLSKTDRELYKKKALEQNIVNQIATISNKNNKTVGEITITLQTKNRATVTLEVSYLVENAGWSPIYDLRSKNTSSPMQLIYRANVFQNTGVDWDKTKIKLSTANPTVGGEKPELDVWNVAIEEEYKKRKGKARSTNPSKAETTSGLGYSENDDKKLVQLSSFSLAEMVTVNENAVSTEFDIAVPYSVPSNGQAVLMDVQTYQIPVSYKYFSSPKLEANTFLTAQLTGWEQYNLIEGTANVFFEGTFVGETYLNPSNTEDTLKVSLGRDKKVVIKREVLKEFTSKQFLGSTKKVEYAYEISIRNTKKDSVAITVDDQIPVSKNKEIEVELLDGGGANYDKETGKLIWNVNLSSSEEKKFVFRFTVKYPKNKNIIGL